MPTPIPSRVSIVSRRPEAEEVDEGDICPNSHKGELPVAFVRGDGDGVGEVKAGQLVRSDVDNLTDDGVYCLCFLSGSSIHIRGCGGSLLA